MGLGCSGDGFPNGNPNGYDPVKMAKRGIILYVVACEPSLSGFAGAHDLMAGLAQITEGRYLPLTGAHLLPDVIIGGAKEEVSLANLEKFVQERMDKIKSEKPNISTEEMNAKITESMKQCGMKTVVNDVEESAVYGNYDDSNINMWANEASSLSYGKKKRKKIAQPKANFGYSQKQSCYESAVDHKSAFKMMSRVNKKSKGGYW